MPAPPQTIGRTAASPPASNGGRREDAGAAAGGNRVLASLPSREAKALGPVLEPLRPEPGAVLLEPGEKVGRVVFPASGVVRLSMGFADPAGRGGFGLAGREGLVGLRALFGGGVAACRAVVQVGGEARAASPRSLRAFLHSAYGFRDAVLRCAAAQFADADAAATAACNALHPLRQRAARWLPAVQDRAGPGFSLAQEELAEMLGARRPTVNAVLQRFKAEGIVRSARGWIAVSDAAGLESATCGYRRRVSDARQDLLLRF